MLKTISQTLTPDLPAIAGEVAALFKTRHPGRESRFSSQALHAVALSSLESIFRCMAEERPDALHRYLAGVLLDGGDSDWGVGEVVELFSLGRTALLAALRRCPCDSPELFRRQDALEAFYIDVIARITEQYTDLFLCRQEREHARARILLEASRAVSSSLAPDEVLECLARILAETVDDGCCSIFMRNPETGGLTPQAGWGYDSETCMLSARGLRFCTEGSDLQARDGTSFGLCSLNTEGAAYAGLLPEALRTGTTNIFPITNGDVTLGVAILSSRLPGFVFDDDTISLVEGVLGGVAMTLELAANTRRTERKLKESEGLRRIANRLLSRPDADQESVMTLICDEARELVGGTGSAILLREGDQLVYAYGTGTPQPSVRLFPLHATWYGDIFRHGRTTVITDARAEIPKEQRSPEVRTLIVVPLLEGEEKTGLILVSNKKTGFDTDDRDILEMLAAQAVLALRNARLAEQGEMIVVAEERRRLARELHDSVTQALYAANLCAEAAHRSLNAGKHEGAAGQLEALRGMTRQALREMRSLIFDLHPPELESEGLVGAIRSRLDSVEARSGINPELHVTGEEHRLPIRMEEELFRIAIEALNNAAKHSGSNRVRVSLDYAPGNIVLSVSDNGKGCDLDAVPAGGMGLRSMRERAERVSGRLEITSSRGEGCMVRVSAPLKEEGGR
jgi:signal transduction histidine kinase